MIFKQFNRLTKMKNVFRNAAKSLLTIGICLHFSSCTEFLKGKPEKQNTLIVNKDSISCLKEVSNQLKSFLKSETNAKDVDQSFNCLDKTLNEFQTRVEGRSDAQSFTAEDLFEIFKNFLADAEISKEATQELLLLKSAILGGTEQKITKKEISDLRKFLVALKPELKSLIPYARVFTFEKGETAISKNLIRDAFAQLNMSLKNLMKATSVARSTYQFEDFKRLISHFSLAQGQQADIIRLASKVKNVLVGNYVLQTEADYQLFIDNLTEVLRLYAIQVQGTIRFEIATSVGMNEAIDYIQDWLILLENSVQYKNKQTILLETLNPVVEEIARLDILPIKVNGSTLVNFYRTLLMRVFDSGREGEINKLTGLTALHFSNIKREVAIYRIYMHFIDQTTPNASRVPIAQIQLKLKAFDPNLEYILNKFDKFEQTKILRAFDELRAEFLTSRPVVYRFKKMVIAANQNDWDQNWEDLARGLYSKVLARQLLIGWGVTPITSEIPAGYASKEVKQSYMTEEGLIHWYADFRDFGIESKAFDKRSANAGAESFKQADLLTYSANGDGRMSYMESVQYVNMLVSGGGETLAEIRAGMTRGGCNLTEIDGFDFYWNQEACAINELKKNFKFYFSNLSYLNQYVQTLNAAQFSAFYFDLMEVARINPKFKGSQVETADLRQMSIILHYIESLYAVYDKNGNMTFSPEEFRDAYKARFSAFARDYARATAQAEITKFNSTLGRLAFSCWNEEDLIRESFIYLVYNGTPPTEDSLLYCIAFRDRPLIDFSIYPEVDRKKIISTFKILKDVLGSKK